MAKRGRKPIPPELVERIRGSLAAGTPVRQTARECGVSQKTVQNIHHGRHCKEASASVRGTVGVRREFTVLGPGEIFVVAQRCPECGGMCEVLPCRACLAEKVAARNRYLQRVRQLAQRAAAWQAGGREPSHRKVVRGQGGGLRPQE